MIKISKTTLRQLNDAVNKLDTDSGKVFTGFVGALNMADKLYHGELHYATPGTNPPKETVSLGAILAPPSAATMRNIQQERSMTDGDA